MTIVPPDGPVPCDLAVIGEAPGRAECEQGKGFVGPSGRVLWAQQPGDLDLMNVIACRPRETCYVSNVCNEPLPDSEWWKLSLQERDVHVRKLLEELASVRPKLVLAFGRRAAMALVPQFSTMSDDHGKPGLGPGGKFLSMALWHPAAYLRGNSQALGAIATDLAKIDTLLTDGLVELLQPLPEPEPKWPDRIGFLLNDGPRKSARCMYCSNKDVAAYIGEELKWRLCRVHAERASKWAEDNMEALYEHRAIAMQTALVRSRDRIEEKMTKELLGKETR